MAFVDTEARPAGEVQQKVGRLKMLFLDAADIVDKYGLCKRMRSNASGSVCIAGALAWAHDGHPDGVDPFINFAYEYMTQKLGMGAANWNDRPERTKDEVVEKLREMAQGL